MNFDVLKVAQTVRSAAKSIDGPIKGVLPSHIHLDHIMEFGDGSVWAIHSPWTGTGGYLSYEVGVG
ncbi:MAG: hypothetical protein ACI9CE_002940 [Flavobacterium sp.]|jgi:hypothetical protein